MQGPLGWYRGEEKNVTLWHGTRSAVQRSLGGSILETVEAGMLLLLGNLLWQLSEEDFFMGDVGAWCVYVDKYQYMDSPTTSRL